MKEDRIRSIIMLSVTEKASTELKKVLSSEKATGKELVIFFQGYGWGGPSLGLALDESKEGMEAIESNGIKAFIDAELKEMVTRLGSINIDYVSPQFGQGGYTITVGDKSGCEGCSC